MSAFAEILKRVVDRVPGAVGAVFADGEGEAVDHFADVPPLDIRLIGAHWGVVLLQASQSFQRLGAGDVDELWVEGEHALVIIRRVTEQYYVVLTARRGVHLATARRELERGVRSLRGEM